MHLSFIPVNLALTFLRNIETPKARLTVQTAIFILIVSLMFDGLTSEYLATICDTFSSYDTQFSILLCRMDRQFHTMGHLCNMPNVF